VLHELEGARSALLAGEPWAAIPRVRRAVAVDRLLLHHLEVLETMSPDRFFEFRDPLAPASGFESVQFREIELLSGGVGASPGAVAAHDEAARARLDRRATEPTLWDAVVSCLSQHQLLGGLASDRSTGEVLGALAEIYRSHEEPERAVFHELFESLLDHDEAIARWRYHHMLMAAREIGRRPGTGGSLGVEYLARTLETRFFPLLWEIRSIL
jgi:tryptophan 2,3-dioxygenase